MNDYDCINPDHYKTYSYEVISMMASIYGPALTAVYCEMSAFKYRMRAGNKPGNSAEQDFAKEEWYLKKAKELRK